MDSDGQNPCERDEAIRFETGSSCTGVTNSSTRDRESERCLEAREIETYDDE